ncbi:Ribonuclease HIII [Methanosarcinaceae archaeon Ag5]|uniref:Ribonuclease HII n=1 Tax=Methanolapillus africanus TaxID=3028297 RepID=A0AAE4MK18_9EURY|nr:Ribonuclease HIII [Methanosarcinaceae archaeon Ag5]
MAEQIKLGVDEAGKGPVIGPMCIAGVCATEEQERKLKALGVADSKKLTAKKREQLAPSIQKYVTSWYVLEIEPAKIDDLRNIMTMNEIMVVGFSKVVGELAQKTTVNTAILDAADVKEERFGLRVKEECVKKNPKTENIEFISKHKADNLSPVVSAASILAKVRRDELIEGIKKREGVDFGSGYPSDPKTVEFLEKTAGEKKEFPDYVRKSWETAKKYNL